MELSQILSVNLTAEELLEQVKEEQHKIFASRGITNEERGQFIKSTMPQCEEEILKIANYALDGRVKLPGTGGKYAFAGNPPDWFNKSFKDEEFLWQLNRMDHWLHLLYSYSMTGEEAYAKKVIQECEDWIQRQERPALVKDKEQARKSFYDLVDINAWRLLDVGIRLHKSWPLILEYLLFTPYMTPEFFESYLCSLHEQAELLAELAPMFFPKADHNHYVMENLGLLWVAGRFPQMKNAKAWKEQAISELERCMEAQMMKDGGHIEGCPMYHNGCIYWFALGALFGQDFGFQFSKGYMERLKKGLEYSMHTFRPSGTIVPYGDSKTNEEAIVGAFYGYLIFGRLDYMNTLLSLTSKEVILTTIKTHMWHARNLESLMALLDDPESQGAGDFTSTVSWQRDLDQAMMRTDWSKEAISLHFACHTPIHAGHSHIDPCSFDLTALGKPLVVDPGVFTYRNIPERKLFKSAKYHNTLTINDEEPFEYIDTWEYGPQEEGHILYVSEDPNNLYTIGEHDNYKPARHQRLIAIVDQEFVIVLDSVKGLVDKDRVQLYYHLDALKAEVGLNGRDLHTHNEEVDVLLATTANLHGEILDGYISDIYDIKRPSLRIRYEDEGREEKRCFGTVILPYRKGTVPEITNVNILRHENAIQFIFSYHATHYCCQWQGNEFTYTSTQKN